MGRRFSVLMLCFLAFLILAGCEKNNPDSDTSQTESEISEDSSSEPSKTVITHITDNAPPPSTALKTTSEKDSGEDIEGTDEKLFGNWFDDTDETGFGFRENGVLFIEPDYTRFMYFNKNMEFCGDGMESCPIIFDGSEISVHITKDDIDSEILRMERINGESDKDTIDGYYILTGGMLKDEFSAQFRPSQDIEICISGETLRLCIPSGEYAADGKKIRLSSSVFFGNEAIIGKYEIKGDKLRIDADESIINLVKAD